MTRNDTFFKILFTLEIGLVPLAMAAYLLFPIWSVGVFVAGILVAKIWIELFKNKGNKVHIILNSIGNIITISSLVIFFTIYGYINVVLCVFIAILVFATNIFKIAMFNKIMPEMIDAVDSCYVLFECLTLIAFTFVVFHTLVTDIALFALLLTSAVSVIYKAYYLLRNHGAFDKIKNLFRRK